MALQYYQVTATTTPQIIAKGVAGQKTHFKIMNVGTTNGCYIGDATVSSTTGYLLPTATSTATGARLEITLNAEDVLYVAAVAGTTPVTVIATGA